MEALIEAFDESFKCFSNETIYINGDIYNGGVYIEESSFIIIINHLEKIKQNIEKHIVKKQYLKHILNAMKITVEENIDLYRYKLDNLHTGKIQSILVNKNIILYSWDGTYGSHMSIFDIELGLCI